MNEKPKRTWAKDVSHFAFIMEYLCLYEKWECEVEYDPSPYDVIDTSEIGTSLYKSVNRYEWRANHFNPSDWYVADYSPGGKNK